MTTQLSPCLYCSRVPDPGMCDNKKCRPWQRWFSRRWDDTRQTFCRSMSTATVEPDGVPIGGKLYNPPDRLREYLGKPPCMRCPLPTDLCEAACPVLHAWMRRKEEFYELES